MEVLEGMCCVAMVNHVALREKSESVHEFEDGVARLVDGHDDDALVLPAQTAHTHTHT